MEYYHLGYDYFTPEAGKYQTMFCLACESPMDVDLNVARTRGRFGIPFPEDKIRHEDIFRCLNVEQGWHAQIIRLMQAVRDTPSKKLADLMELEIAEIRQTKQATKVPGLWAV